MAQTGSAQREPSMEEILASIRRIIEDSDSIRTPTEGHSEAPAQIVPPEVEAVVEVEEEVEVFRAELDVEPASQPVSMADIQAAVMRERSGLLENRAPSEPFAAPEEEAADRSTDEPIASDTRDPVQPQPALSQPVNEPFAFAPAAFASPEPEPEPEIESVNASDDEAASSTEPAIHGSVEPRSSILSLQAERQVAAAFGELSEAFAASRRRSFDEVAEEMLRPMLQDWLDNNLPGLVEKLVREEIERVARGGKA